MKQAIQNLEKMTGQKLGSDNAPLILAIRSAMPLYIPGVMPTFLNIGVTRNSYEALSKIYNRDVAAKIYLNNLQTIAFNLFDEQIKIDQIENVDSSIDRLYEMIRRKDEKLLTDPYHQIMFFLQRAHEYYEQNQDLLLTFFRNKQKYPSLILQKMVWTILDDESYPGVLYSRHSRTGLGIQIESLPNIFGDEIMTGLIDTDDHEFFDRESIKKEFPAVYHFEPLLWEMEKKLQSPVTVEFAAESHDNIYMFAVLQLNASELTGRATLLSAIDLYQKKIIDAKRVVSLIKPYHLTQIFSDRIDDRSFKFLKFFSKGVSILPRTAVSARIFFSPAKALEAKRHGDKVVICRDSFIPADTLVMGEVDGILSLTPAAIHVVTACRGYGVPAFLNLEKFGVKLLGNKLVNSEGLVINEGDWITISSKRQKIFIGKASFKQARFQRYLAGEKFDLAPKEERVFINMAKAFQIYDRLVENLRLEEIVRLDELTKLIRSNLRNKPEKAKRFMNSWFDSNIYLYIQQILESELGSHQDQHKLYKMLSLDRKIRFFQKIIPICQKDNLKGFTAGSFMLGRFLCLTHPVKFWQAFDESYIVRMLNEYILFEKYMNVLNQVGEREVNRARKQILNEGLGNIQLKTGNAIIFMTLKLAKKNMAKMIELCNLNDTDKETKLLLELLQKPYSEFYNFEYAWSIGMLKDLCKEAGIPLPKPEDI
jgi:phosphoenolpyruvate synthase/pyruvate phosphate dikinase